MKTVMGHVRANLIAYLALFVALGGTGYAAISIPAGSVGARQLRNGAVTAKKLEKGSITSAKLDGRSIAGYVAFWARIDQAGQVVGSSKPATTSGWSTGFGDITFAGELPSNCFAVGNVSGATSTGYVDIGSASASGATALALAMHAGNGAAAPQNVDVAEICP